MPRLVGTLRDVRPKRRDQGGPRGVRQGHHSPTIDDPRQNPAVKSLPEVPWVTVYCGARSGADPAYRISAVEVGRAIAREGAGLVFGGGHVGLMGVVADAVLAAGAPVHGVIPQALERRELAHRGVTLVSVVQTMHERKALMAERGRGFLVLPGGLGTLDETFEALTWRQLGLHQKPVVLLNVRGLFTPLVRALEVLSREGFAPHFRDYLTVETDPGTAVRRVLGRT